MQPEIVIGNAQSEGASRWGWFLGHFIEPKDDLRSTPNLEIKWAVHQVGDARSEWAANAEATTISILINGRFCVQFPDREIVLSQSGDYVLWLPKVPHTWRAEADSTLVTVRWPSKSGDSINTQI